MKLQESKKRWQAVVSRQAFETRGHELLTIDEQGLLIFEGKRKLMPHIDQTRRKEGLEPLKSKIDCSTIVNLPGKGIVGMRD